MSVASDHFFDTVIHPAGADIWTTGAQYVLQPDSEDDFDDDEPVSAGMMLIWCMLVCCNLFCCAFSERVYQFSYHLYDFVQVTILFIHKIL